MATVVSYVEFLNRDHPPKPTTHVDVESRVRHTSFVVHQPMSPETCNEEEEKEEKEEEKEQEQEDLPPQKSCFTTAKRQAKCPLPRECQPQDTK